MSECIFCQIVQKKRPANVVYEDEKIMAFWDARPVAPVHVLIVPKEHISTLNDIPPDSTILADIGRAASTTARKLGVADSGYRFSINVNRGGGQVIFHLHAHLIAGRDFGTFLLKTAIAAATAWRKLISSLRSPRS